MSNLFTYIIELRDKMSPVLKGTGGAIVDNTKKVNKLRTGVKQLNNTPLSGLTSSFGGLFRAISPIVLLTGALYKLKGGLGESQDAFQRVSAQESKLATIMGNMMGARNEDVQSILNLANAQQKLGVVSADIVTAGAQELATYLTKKSSLEKIIPVMNDMVAQQYGLSASQDQAVGIATMLGKVMDGQVGALSRYGYKFDKAQEKILKYGTEAQRAAVLVDVVSSAVGGVNENLAKTPQGILKQQANDLGVLSERFGGIIVLVKNAFAPLTAFFINVSQKVLTFFEENKEKIHTAMSVVSSLVVTVFEKIISAIRWAHGIYQAFTDGIRNGNPVFIVLTGLVVGLTAAVIGYKLAMLSLAGVQMIIAGIKSALVAYEIVVFAVKNATSIWAAAQWLLNVALSANPVGLVIAGIVALIAIIAFLIIKIDGWGETWDNVIKFCGLVFEGFKTALQLKWLTIQDFFMKGLEMIETGWYKLQGLWDSDAANAGLANLEAQRNARAKEIADTQGKLGDLAKQMSEMEVIKLKVNDTSLGDVVKGIGSKLGISAPGIPGMSGGGTGGAGGLGDGTGGGGASGGAASSIATGGSKTTHITLNLGNLVHTMTINSGDIKEGAQKVRDIVQDELSRALIMVQANV